MLAAAAANGEPTRCLPGGRTSAVGVGGGTTSLRARSSSCQTLRLRKLALRGWAVPGSNGRPPACKARAAAAVYCRLSLRPLRERSTADICCALLRFVASTVLPHD